MKSLLIVAFALIASIAHADDCPLSGIKPAVYNQDQTYNDAQTPYVWYLSPCAMQAAPGEGACNPAAGYFQEFDTQANGAKCQFSLTEIKKPWTKFTSSLSGISGYSATFANTQGDRVAEITVLCDTNAGNLQPTGVAAASGTGTITWQVQLQSDQACDNGPGPNPPTPAPTPGNGTTPPPAEKKKAACGGGCAFLIIIFIGPLIYVLIFVAWNFKNGKRGKELAPHPEFWASIPGLIKDGCIFFAQKVCGLVDKIRGKGGSGGEGSYNEV